MYNVLISIYKVSSPWAKLTQKIAEFFKGFFTLLNSGKTQGSWRDGNLSAIIRNCSGKVQVLSGQFECWSLDEWTACLLSKGDKRNLSADKNGSHALFHGYHTIFTRML